LIDENLKTQEADKQAIILDEQEINKAIAGIEKQNGGQPGTFDDYLEQIGISRDSFLAQLKAQLSWNKLVQKKIAPRVRVGEDEISDAIKRTQSRFGPSEVQIQTLTLPVDNSQSEPSVQK